MAKDDKKKPWKKILLIIFLVIIIITGIIVGILYSKLFNLNIQEIDKSNLGINDDLYSKVSDHISESDFKNIKNFVLFGIDTQSSGDGQDAEDFIGRTDTIMIVSINPRYKTIKLISIPRDTYAEIEGHGKMKINYAHLFGGAQLAIKTINETFSLNLTEYATVDFSGLVHIINDIGGIDLFITEEEESFINRYSSVAYSISGNKKKWINKYGNVTLDGEQAVTHARNRTNGDGDFTRTERQRKVIEALFTKISKMDAGKIYSLIDMFLKEITTNIDIPTYMGLLSDILLNKSTYLSSIISAQIPNENHATSEWIDGIYYFVPSDEQKMKEDMWNYIYLK